MGKQVHFVVVADLDSETWWVDDDTFTARFGGNEGTWNTATEQWEDTDWDDNIAGLNILHKPRDVMAECNDCGRKYLVKEMVDIGRQGTGYECEKCYHRGIEE